MKLSAPVYLLKNKAKTLKNTLAISMAEALNQIAREEGYSTWSLLLSKVDDMLPSSDREILAYLNPGDLMLLASRPRMGKSALALAMMVQAAKEGRMCFLFSLEFIETEVVERINQISGDVSLDSDLLELNFSDDISSEYILQIAKNSVVEGSLIVVDYLQLLDQKRINPNLSEQLQKLKGFARETGCVIVFLSQVDRAVEGKEISLASIDDVRMPNPFDVEIFNKVMLMGSESRVFVKPKNFSFSLVTKES